MTGNDSNKTSDRTRPRRVLVAGATGYIGGRLTPRLVEAGHAVRCMGRDPARLEGRQWGDVEIVEGDVLRPETLDAALAGIDAAYYLVHSMGGEGDFAERDRRGAENFARAAKRAGVERVVYLGGLGSSESADLSEHLRSRHEVGEILARFGPPVTEFRAAIIVGSGSISFEMIRYLTERLPVMITPRWVSTRCQPIAVRQVLYYLLHCLEVDESAGEVVEIGGPDVLAYRDMMLGYASVRGLRRFMISVPVLTPTLSSRWVDLVTPIPSSIARPLIEGLKNEVVVRDEKAKRLFPDAPMIPYRQAVELALSRLKEHRVETVWSSALSSGGSPAATKLESTQSEGMFIECHKHASTAPPELLFDVFTGIGGVRGWFVYEYLWAVRAFIDRLIGGVGFRRGRRHPDELYVGEAVDWWRVEEIIPGERLRLRAEMVTPGRAWLQFDARPCDHPRYRSELAVTAFFEPKGLLGHIYWWALLPLHPSIFRDLAQVIAKRAAQRGAASNLARSASNGEEPEKVREESNLLAASILT